MRIKDLIPKDWGKGNGGDMVKIEPDRIFSSLQKEMNRLFDDFSMGMFDWTPWSRERGVTATIMPRVDVVENEDEIVISAELPGMDEKDIDVSLTQNHVSIKGEKKAEKETQKTDYYRMERSYGSFQRSIRIPEIDRDKVDASFKKGVLTIKLAKTAKAKEDFKKIAVRTE